MRTLTPFPTPHFSKQVELVVSQPFCASFSGEFTANVSGAPLGAPKTAGRVANVFLSVQMSGKDDSNPLQITGEVYINSTSCLTTRPGIIHVSGEASQQKTTKITGDTGIVQAEIDADNATYNPGDMITYDLLLTRTSSPTTEIINPCIVVELEPESP
jgi:hypothetical protein